MTEVLLVYPKNPKTFWSYDYALSIAGKRSAFPPNGLLTVAGLLPKDYSIRLVDENVNKLRDSDIMDADIILTSAMGIHKKSLENILRRAHEYKKPVLAGGPLPTQHYDKIDGSATFFLGEAETGIVDIVRDIIEKPYDPRAKVIDRRKQFLPLETTPIQRFDLIKNTMKYYAAMAIQITRGCPKHCTYCNIGALYGRETRIKACDKIITELDTLYNLGWRGSVMIVDDNVAGNQEALIPMLDDIKSWQKSKNYPFSFFTQASLEIFGNKKLMEAMYEAGFNQVFFGVESPSPESLKFMGATKNLQDSEVSLIEKLIHIGENYFEPQAGLILGFQTDPDNIVELMINLVQKGRIPTAMVGPLGILPETADYFRYSRENRLNKDMLYSGDSGIFTRQLSYIPQDKEGNVIDPNIILNRHRQVLESINSPTNYFDRTKELLIHRKRKPLGKTPLTSNSIATLLRSIFYQGIAGSYRSEYWKFLSDVASNDIRDIPDAVSAAVKGHHLLTMTRESLKVDELNTSIQKLMDLGDEYLTPLRNKGHGYVRDIMIQYRKIKKDFRDQVDGLEKVKSRFAHFFDKGRFMNRI